VCLGGIDLKKISFASYRKMVSAAFQQPFLFDDTIYGNIAFGSEKPSRASVEEAADMCGLSEFIAGLPKGYGTMLGEDAFRLSQGFKQRVALARAVLRDAYLLVLDEATASIDSFSERKVFDALRRRRQGLITIVISHRLFSVQDADRMFFLRDGVLAEEGSHVELLAKSAEYRSFFEAQLRDHETIKRGA
jgi:ABC-type multidrug transport system fused ATPase/permease subunit